MPVFVLLTGVIMLLFGVAFLIAPSIVRHWFSRITVWKQFYPIAALRIVIGIKRDAIPCFRDRHGHYLNCGWSRPPRSGYGAH